MNTVTFDNLAALNWLWLVLAVLAIGTLGVWQRQRALRRFADAPLLLRIAPRTGWLRPLVRLLLVTACLILTVGALLEPRWGATDQTVVRRGIDMMVLLDASRSMLARDVTPSRLDRAKLALSDDLVRALGGERVGLIAFAGVTDLVCPLTNDYGFYRMAIEDVLPANVPRGGTLIGDAIRRAADAFAGDAEAHKLILLITDGEDQDSYPVEAAANVWADHRIPVVVIVLGDEREGARIPVPSLRGEQYLIYNGEVVWSKPDLALLRQVAEAGGGELFQQAGRTNFIPVGTKNFDLGEIYRQVILPAVRYEERSEEQLVQRPAQYQWFALPALLLLILDSFLRDGPPRRTVELQRDRSSSERAA